MDSHHEKQRQTDLMITSAVFTGTSAAIVFARIISRQFILRNFGKDDILMVIALLFTAGYLAELGLMGKYGMGLMQSELTLSQSVSMMQITLAIEATYYAIVTSIKLSICFFYLRIASDKIFRHLCLGTVAVLSVFCIACIVTTLAQCQPFEKIWDFTGAVKGHCINTTAFFYSTSAFHIVTDIWLLCLPIRVLRGIQRPAREKIALFVIFGVGTFACICSIIRLHTIYLFTLSTDPFHDGIQVNLWSMIEVNTAIICASVPALKPLLSREQRNRTRAARSGGSSGYLRHVQSVESGLTKPRNGLLIKSPNGSQRTRWAMRRWSKEFGGDSISTTMSSTAEGPDRNNRHGSGEESLASDNTSHMLFPYPPGQPYTGPGIHVSTKTKFEQNKPYTG